jgi:hypothetical protein
MTNDPPPMPPPGESGPGDEIDFAAIVAEQSGSARSSRDRRRERGGRSAESAAVRGLDDSAVVPVFAAIVDPPVPPPSGPTQRSDSRWWRIGYPAVIVLLVLLVPVMVWTGLRVILDSTDGQLVKRVTDPTAPGYEAVVEKTPTAVVALTGPDGQLDSVAVLALTSDTSGGILTIPSGLVYQAGYGPIPLSTYYASGGIESLSSAVGALLNLSFTESIVVPSTEWATLIKPYGTVTVTTPDPVRDPKDVVVFQKGTIDLKPDQVWPFLSDRGSKESDLNRLIRQQAFWKGWTAKVRSSGVQYPGPIDAGLGRFVTALSKGQVSISALPVVVAMGSPPEGPQLYVIQKQASQDAVAGIVPFPDGAAGGRPRLRVLDGTGQLNNGIEAAIVLAAAGGQVDVVGNARTYGAPTTQFIYYDGTSEETAKQLRDALGIGELVESKQSNSATDLMVVLGEDYLAKVGPSGAAQASPTTGGTS